MRISQKYLDFDSQAKIFLAYSTANAARVGITDDQITALTAANGTWETTLALYVDPATHTPANVAATGTEYKSYSDIVTGMQQQVKNNRGVELTDTDYENLFIHRDAQRRGQIPRPSIAPDNTLIESKHLTTTISVFQPTSATENYRRLPPDIDHVGRKIALVAQGAPAPAEADYHAIESVGTGTFQLVWQPEQEGMTCNLITWYNNYRGEAGPTSVPIAFAII